MRGLRLFWARTAGIVGATVAMGVMGSLVGPASASGPAAPGKDLLTFDCAGLGVVSVSVDTGGRSWGAGQITGQQGHVAPIALTYTIVDTTTDTLLESRSFAKGGGQANQQQDTTACADAFSATAAEFYEGVPLPPGVSPGDVIQFSATVTVVVQPT